MSVAEMLDEWRLAEGWSAGDRFRQQAEFDPTWQDENVFVAVEHDSAIVELTEKVKRSFIEGGPQGGNWSETIQIIKKIPLGDKSVDVLLIEARCHEMLGNHKLALSAAGKLIQKAASYDSWVNDSPRMMAATLGANAAMQLGLSENAVSVYQTVLKFDPEQKRARKQYRGLKKVIKLMNKAEEEVSDKQSRSGYAMLKGKENCWSVLNR